MYFTKASTTLRFLIRINDNIMKGTYVLYCLFKHKERKKQYRRYSLCTSYFFSFSVITASMLLVFVSGCKSNSSSPTAPATSNPSNVTVSMAGNTFSPASITVPVHTTIIWNNNSSIAHTSTSVPAGKWATGNIPAGTSKQTTFDSTGVYPYHCTYHSGMVGVITVQ